MAKHSPKVALPGQMYQKNGRWWWKVRLPGEARVRARALKPNGARVAPKTRKVAEEVACERWRLSIEAETEARVKSEIQAEAEKAVAKAKARAADAIAKVEAKLAAQSKQAKIPCTGKTTETEGWIEQAKAQFEQREKAYRDALAQAEARAQAEAALRAEAEQRAQMEAQARAIAEAKAQAEAELRSEAEQRANLQTEAGMKAETKFGRQSDSVGRTGPCEGCGRQDVPEKDLAKIDSGQLVCPDCLMLIRT